MSVIKNFRKTELQIGFDRGHFVCSPHSAHAHYLWECSLYICNGKPWFSQCCFLHWHAFFESQKESE